jgi:hypothetical protein
MNKRSAASLFLSLVLLAAVGAVGVTVGRHWGNAAPASTTTTTVAATEQPATAIWPFVSSATRFGDPLLAAQAFAIDYLGFTRPLIGAFQRGDSRSGEVQVRPSSLSIPTTILVRQLTSSNTWWVLGASSPHLQVTSPMALRMISSPVMLTGRSTAFEAVVNVEVRQDGSLNALVRSTVMGGSMGVMGPYARRITFPKPSARGGAIVYRTLSAKDGSVVDATALRVSFAP